MDGARGSGPFLVFDSIFIFDYLLLLGGWTKGMAGQKEAKVRNILPGQQKRIFLTF